MNSLFQILSDKNFDEPPEIASIKKYVQETFHVEVGVSLKDDRIIITAPHAALATSLRLRQTELRRRCQIPDKRLVFRIGQG